MKRIATCIVAAVVAFAGVGLIPYEASASLAANKIAKVGSSSKTVNVGNDFELEVKKGSKVKDSNLWWSIGDTSVVKFDDDDRSDEEMEFRAVKAGTTKISCKNKLTGGKITYTVTVKKASNTISRIGNASRTVNKGTEFELAVKLGGAIGENSVYWTISDTSIVGYDDDDRYDNEMEFRAKKAGTTKITAKNLLTGGKLVYTVTVKQPASKYISRVGSATKTVEVGDDIDIKVSRGSAVASSKVYWTISDTSILRFEDGGRYGSTVEVEGRKTGTTKVTAKNLITGGKIVYTVKVVPDYD